MCVVVLFTSTLNNQVFVLLWDVFCVTTVLLCLRSNQFPMPNRWLSLPTHMKTHFLFICAANICSRVKNKTKNLANIRKLKSPNIIMYISWWQWWYKSPVICLVNSANEVLTSVMTHKRWCAINHVQDQVCKGWVNILSLDSGLLIICFALSLHVQTWTQRGAGTGHSVTTPQMQPS